VIGRPQLDVLQPPIEVDKTRKILLYAPTWQGDQEANNYSSLDIYGEKIMKALLAQEKATVFYKPHPRIVENKIPQWKNLHQNILSLIENANKKDPKANHQFITGDPLRVLQIADLLIADVSSVTIDYLYLKPDGVLLICDRRSNGELFKQVAPVSAAIPNIDKNNINEIEKMIRDYLVNYPRRDEYQKIRNYYFGEGNPGDSLNKFISMITELINRRDLRVAQMPDLP
jgi:CDP-glycerol glycerophosphotransferase (TagB/SpsB family)